MKNLQKFKDFLTEGLPVKEINPLKFPNPQKQSTEFFTKGKKDGDANDDVVYTKEIGIPAKSLKASQDAVYLGKALGMAVGGVEGGDLDAVISKDNRILDGHHRWAATIFNNPSAKINGVKADLNIGDLVPVLRAAGDAMGNKRGLPPEGGDISIFVATIDDVKKAIFDGEWMDKKYYNREKAIKWFNKVGEHNIEKALSIIKRNGPPLGAPPRADMPKIKPDQVDKVSNDLSAGKIDVREPYNESQGYINKSTMKNLQSFEEFLNESKLVYNFNDLIVDEIKIKRNRGTYYPDDINRKLNKDELKSLYNPKALKKYCSDMMKSEKMYAKDQKWDVGRTMFLDFEHIYFNIVDGMPEDLFKKFFIEFVEVCLSYNLRYSSDLLLK